MRVQRSQDPSGRKERGKARESARGVSSAMKINHREAEGREGRGGEGLKMTQRKDYAEVSGEGKGTSTPPGKKSHDRHTRTGAAFVRGSSWPFCR